MQGYLCNEETNQTEEILRGLRQQERRYNSFRYDYLHSQDESSCSLGIEEMWRRKMCEWAYDIIDYYESERYIVSIAFDYVDRFLSHASKESKDEKQMDKHKFQLLVTTSIYLAQKLHKTGYGRIRCKTGLRNQLDDFVHLSNGLFTIQDFNKMEYAILDTLNWQLNPPTTVEFIFHLLNFILEQKDEGKLVIAPKAASGPMRSQHKNKFSVISEHCLQGIFDRASFISELIVGSYEICTHHSPSCIGLASILSAMDAVPVTGSRLARAIIVQTSIDILSLQRDELGSVQSVYVQIKDLYPNLFINNEQEHDISASIVLLNSKFSPVRKRVLSPTSTMEMKTNESSLIDNKKLKLLK